MRKYKQKFGVANGVAEALAEYVRVKMREEGFLRRILPPVEIGCLTHHFVTNEKTEEMEPVIKVASNFEIASYGGGLTLEKMKICLAAFELGRKGVRLQ